MSSANYEATETSRATDNVRVRVHSIDTLRDEIPEWDALEKAEKREAIESIEPDREHFHRNTTVDGLHQLIVDYLDPSQSVTESASYLAVGTDDTTPSKGDSTLGNEVYRSATTDDSDNGTTIYTTTFLDTSEANGWTLREVGLFTASSGGTLLNHSLIQEIAKDNTKAVTIDVELTFTSA